MFDTASYSKWKEEGACWFDFSWTIEAIFQEWDGYNQEAA